MELKDFMDMKLLQKLQDDFSTATGLAAIAVGKHGEYITEGSNFTDFCMKYTRGSSEEGNRRCIKCDNECTGTYFCHAGLMDFAFDIVVNGEKMGAMIGGQVLPAPPDEQQFRNTAKELGIDPDAYYEAVKKLGDLAKEGTSNLTLMGIEPTYASEKYGYIIPTSKESVSLVKEFKEKPDTATAEKYIEQGALWNAGVFAFKLSYLLSKSHEMIDFTDYRDLYSKYSTLTKISFDYAVVEKEPEISVLRYSGRWKDVGTWNMMAEVMSEPTIGNVMLESGDGILVADKEQSGYMKPYVEKISTEVHFAEKSWGEYQVIDAGEGYITVKASLKAGSRMSYHSHEFRDEIWTVLRGRGRTVIDGMEQDVRPGDVVTMAAGCKHTVIAVTDLVLLETQIGESISEKDKIKFDFTDPSEGND